VDDANVEKDAVAGATDVIRVNVKGHPSSDRKGPIEQTGI
jgi:hypothetical protein